MNRRQLDRRHVLGIVGATALAGVVAPRLALAGTAAGDVTSAAGSTPATTLGAGTDPLIPPSPGALGAPPTPPPTISTAEGAAPMATVLDQYDAYGTDAGPGEFPRVVRHAMGETTIELAPQRVVVLDTGELDAMVQVGLTPVGTAEYTDAGLATYITDAVADVPIVGLTAEPDLEMIASLEPDLILSSNLRNEEIYPQLSQIAPTVFALQPGVSFRPNFRLYCQATGRETEGLAVVNRYAERARVLNAALPAERPSVTVVNVRADHVRIYQRANFSGMVLDDHGFPRDEASNVDDFALYPSIEELGSVVTGDLIVLAVQAPESNPFAAELVAGDIWNLLPAAQAGNVLTVDATAWIGGIMYGAAFRIQDDLASWFGVSLS
ncbi:MAG TPA: iron-siderophore ABC transporter substrate-binding protein [Thermomicrobiales bacterium]|nr:iron-siderophore ABC transporter substrate-binding protein [Thermomicrobiales bacterium]